ncbi:Hypothetical protein AA314_05914 [Archangium gephyra]|nr:Hypothetical protein AA314_05914 [Archangium gephyra]
MLCGCSTPALDFELLSPKEGEVGASITARLTVTGTEDISFNSFIKIIDVRHPDTDFRSVQCFQQCAPQEFLVPSGTYEVFGTMTYVSKEGEEKTLTSEKRTVQIDATPIVAFLIPPLPPGPRMLRLLVTRPVLASSVNTDTLQVTRTFQSGPTRLQMTTEPVPIEVSLVDRTITLTGDFSAPARYVLSIKGVRDGPGNKVVTDLPFDRQYFAHGPDLHEHIGGQLERLELDEQQRLYHLSMDTVRQLQTVSRLEGGAWAEVVTRPAADGSIVTLDRQGLPVSASYPVRGGDIVLERWNGSTWEAWGPTLGEAPTTSTGFFLVRVRVDAQNRPLVLVTSGANAPVTASTRLYRLDGSSWTALSHSIPAGTVEHTFFTLGSSLAVGWHGSSSGGDSFAARIADDALVPLSVPSGLRPDWSSAVTNGAGQTFVSRVLASHRSSVLSYDGLSFSEVGDMRGYFDPTDPGGGNTILGDVRALTVDETGAPIVFMRSRIYAGRTDGEQIYRFVLTALRFDGRDWLPLRGAPAPVLESGEPEVSWMSSFPVGSTPVALAAAYLPNGTLWMLELRGFESGGVARTYVLRSSHVP